MTLIQVKRVYEPASPTDGFRVLVDRLWPRGVTKDAACIDLWAKDVAPSTALRQDFHSGRLVWPQFVARYRAELSANPALGPLAESLREKDVVTLVFAAKDVAHTQAQVLADVLKAASPSR